MGKSIWGEAETRFFYELTPDRVLDAVEASLGRRCTGRSIALNSMENRVYELELELEEKPRHRYEAFVVAKFYRPGRWSEEQILEEHAFLRQLEEDEVPAVAPLTFLDGRTLHVMPDTGLYYTVFPKVGGRSPFELDDEQLLVAGRMLARMHNSGRILDPRHRMTLDPTTFGLDNLQWLEESGSIPPEQRGEYSRLVQEICRVAAPWFAEAGTQLIHGDCHAGNLLWGEQGPFWVDFDDAVRGPVVQDLWLLLPGRDAHARRQMQVLLEGYTMMAAFDRRQLRLIEPLRALRFVHFAAWIGRRREDPAFERAFPQYGTGRYWQEQVTDMARQLELCHQPPWA